MTMRCLSVYILRQEDFGCARLCMNRERQLNSRKEEGTRMPTNRLQQLHDEGQSIWLDYIDRTILQNGDLERRVREDALTGMTSNPTIFEKALSEGTAYDDQ